MYAPNTASELPSSFRTSASICAPLVGVLGVCDPQLEQSAQQEVALRVGEYPGGAKIFDDTESVPVGSSLDALDPSEINLRGMVVVALGVVTAIVLLTVVPKDAPYGGVRYSVGAGGVSTLPVASTLPTGSTTTPGSTTRTTTAATTTTKANTATTRKRGSTSNTTVPTTTTFPVAQRPVLKLGSTGPDVVALQQRLTALGYNTGTANGNFGTSTQTAVTNFQKAKNIAADGVVGPTTWAALATG